jgi:hypothetical protein
MGIPLAGTAFILELERRHRAPLSVERVTAALVGGLVGWLWHIALGVDLIRHDHGRAVVVGLEIVAPDDAALTAEEDALACGHGLALRVTA